MSDAHRKSFHTSQLSKPFLQPSTVTAFGFFVLFVFLFLCLTYIEAKETIIPDFTKSTHQKAKEHATDAADRVARYVCECVGGGGRNSLLDSLPSTHENKFD